MSSQGTTGTSDESRAEGYRLLRRIDRFPRWGLTWLAAFTIGIGMLFVQYDIFAINVSFVQTCNDIVAGCEASGANSFIGIPILVSLVGYAIGAIVLGRLSDLTGRHGMLLIAMVITGLGSVYGALSGDFVNFSISRVVVGIGVGADLALINTYINEVAPKARRGRYTAQLFIMAAIGSALGIWAGLFLTTPAAPWPEGLPFAIASDSFDAGWRYMYWIGGILALISILLRLALPESPRWLVHKGRIEKAKEVVASMEAVATKHYPLLPKDDGPEPPQERTTRRLGDLLRVPEYRRRLIVLSLAWALGYVTVYAFSGAFTSVLVRLGFTASRAGIVSAVGLLGFIIAAVVAYFAVEYIERKYWVIIGAVVTLIGAVLIPLGDTGGVWLLFGGAILLFLGQNVWVSPQYSLTAESFPTEFRATGYAVADSVGHVGAGIGVAIVVPAIVELPFEATLLVLVGFLVLAGFVNLFARKTRGRSLEDLSS